MIRIKVYRLSHLIVGAAAIVLAAVVLGLVLRFALAGQPQAVSIRMGDAGATVQAAEAAFSVSAPASPRPGGAPAMEVVFPGDPEGEDEHTDETLPGMQVEVVPDDDRFTVASPTVLIYHTHTQEAYSQVSDDLYVEVSQWRTADRAHSVVRVGEELARLLTERGFVVTHDATDHEPPKLSTAYARSLKTIQSYPQHFDLYIDLHRDAYSAASGPIALSLGSEKLARLMLLVGKGDDFSDKPDYAGNLAFAGALTDSLNSIAPGICRDVLVKKNRYNQHIGMPSILLEVGNNENTLRQALASMPYVADALSILMLEKGAPYGPIAQASN
ncbi:MAG: hypothetical protein GX558_08580 [Clostridiales bacterium]|nr:hypothetical protein [Clostridiales bacterium]